MAVATYMKGEGLLTRISCKSCPSLYSSHTPTILSLLVMHVLACAPIVLYVQLVYSYMAITYLELGGEHFDFSVYSCSSLCFYHATAILGLFFMHVRSCARV